MLHFCLSQTAQCYINWICKKQPKNKPCGSRMSYGSCRNLLEVAWGWVGQGNHLVINPLRLGVDHLSGSQVLQVPTICPTGENPPSDTPCPPRIMFNGFLRFGCWFRPEIGIGTYDSGGKDPPVSLSSILQEHLELCPDVQDILLQDLSIMRRSRFDDRAPTRVGAREW